MTELKKISLKDHLQMIYDSYGATLKHGCQKYFEPLRKLSNLTTISDENLMTLSNGTSEKALLEARRFRSTYDIPLTIDQEDFYSELSNKSLSALQLQFLDTQLSDDIVSVYQIMNKQWVLPQAVESISRLARNNTFVDHSTIIISYFEFEKLCKKYINAEERQKVIGDSLFSNSKSTDYCPKHFLMPIFFQRHFALLYIRVELRDCLTYCLLNSLENVAPSVEDWNRIERGVSRISEHYGYARFRKFKTPRISRQNDNFSCAIYTAFYLFSIMGDPTRFDRLNIEVNERILERLRIYFVLAILGQSVATPLNVHETVEMTEDQFFGEVESPENIETKYSCDDFTFDLTQDPALDCLSTNSSDNQSTSGQTSFTELLSAPLENRVKAHTKFKPPRAAKAQKRKYMSLGNTEQESAKKSKLT